MSYFETDDTDYDEGNGGGGGEFDYGGYVEATAEEKISFDSHNNIRQKKENKEDLATRGESSYTLGPVYHDSAGFLYEPICGKVWKLTQSSIHCNSISNSTPWPGKPEDESIGWICYHDTYPFKGVPWGICLKYDEKGENHHMHGSTFCSPNCVRAYLIERNFEKRHITSTYHFMHKVMQLKLDVPLFTAKPANVLKRFHPKDGISIDEFRKSFHESKVHVLPPNMISVVTLIEEVKYRRENNDVLKKRNELQIQRKDDQKRRRKNMDMNKTKELVYTNITKPNSMMKAMFIKARSGNK